jgi:hypothetical protein
MIGLRFRQFCAVAALAGAPALPAAAEFAAEVYRDDSITVRAGLQRSGNQYVHFGDVLVLGITVYYDPAAVLVQELDATLFTQAWPADNGARLLDWRVQYDTEAESRLKRVHATYRFQILGCPDNDTPTCPGDRDYALPEFVLTYQDLDASDDSARSIRFRTWPANLTVLTTLQSDDEDQLFPFETYFPAGGYPQPLVGEDGKRGSFLTAGITLALLMGGLLMWPFRSRTQGKTAADLPRWRQQLQIVRAADAADDARFFDALRRCLVWYCNDELQLDPFVWLDLAESGDGSDDSRSHAALRSLFIDLLHSPAGQGVEFRKRLETEISGRASGPDG